MEAGNTGKTLDNGFILCQVNDKMRFGYHGEDERNVIVERLAKGKDGKLKWTHSGWYTFNGAITASIHEIARVHLESLAPGDRDLNALFDALTKARTVLGKALGRRV